MIRRPPRSTPLYSSAASDVYKRQEGIFLSVEGDGGEPPECGKPLHFPGLEGDLDAGSVEHPGKTADLLPLGRGRIRERPPAPTGITPFTTIRKFPIPSVRSSSRARSSSSTEVRSGRQTSVNSVLPGSRSAAMARSYFALAPCREATGPMHVWPLPFEAFSIWRDQST